MTKTLTFYTIAERTPKHDEIIVWLREVGDSFAEGYTLTDCEVEYQWTEVDEDGEDTGSGVVYNGEGSLKNHKLSILFDGYEVEDDWLWMPAEEYWGSLDTSE